MANEEKPQGNPLATPGFIPQGAALTEQELGSVSAGDGDPLTMPWSNLKPDMRAKTQKFVDDVLANGGKVNSVDFETGKVNFTPGPGTPMVGPF